MKKYNFIILVFISVLFINGSCEETTDKYYITIQNNSDKEIVFISATYTTASVNTSMAQNTFCLKLPEKMYYSSFIRDFVIKPYSSKKKGMDMTVKHMQTYSDVVLWWSVGVFYLEDFAGANESCEELKLKQKYSLKKEWQITLEDILNAPDFNLVLVYTPEE